MENKKKEAPLPTPEQKTFMDNLQIFQQKAITNIKNMPEKEALSLALKASFPDIEYLEIITKQNLNSTEERV